MKLSQLDIAYALTNRVFELCILPTEKCNFRCKYCYEDFAIGKMPPKKVDAVKKLLENRVDKELDILNISWFGGEPLLGKEIVFDISNFAKNLSDRNGCTFSGSITTNAWYLDGETSRKLVDLGISHYQITLDGPAEFHNNVRVSINTKPTYGRILKNIRGALDANKDISISLRVHIRPHTVKAISNWLRTELADFVNDPRVNFNFFPIRNLGGNNPTCIEAFDSDERENNALVKLNKEFNLPEKESQSTLELTSSTCDGCYASKPNNLVIRADGKIAKCTVAFDDPCNEVGLLQDNGEMQFYENRLQKWFVALETGDADCFGCPLPHVISMSQAS